MRHRPDRTTRGYLRTASVACACFATLALLTSCAGDDDGMAADDDDPSVLSAGLPPLTLPSIIDNPPNAKVGRLVVGKFSTAGGDALARVSRLFAQQVPYTDSNALRPGDVLVLDGSSITPNDLAGADELAARAHAAQVPLLILGFDDALEEAANKLIPTVNITGFSSMSLLLPALPGEDVSAASVLLTLPQEDRQVIMTETMLASISGELLAFHARRESNPKLVAKADPPPGNSDCTSNDPTHCEYVQKRVLGNKKVIDINSDSRKANFNCLSRDWTPYASGGGRHYVGYSSRAHSTYVQAQCPSQQWNFAPVLYLTYRVDDTTGLLADPSRVVYVEMSASLNPRTADKNGDQYAWYQTRHQFDLRPDDSKLVVGDDSGASPPKHGFSWLANAPTTQNGDTTKTDGVTWGLNVSLAINGGVQGGKGSVYGTGTLGGSVSVTHSTTNTIPDWKILDNTDSVNGIWSFDTQQATPYAVDGSTSADCAVMGNFLFQWAGRHCSSLPQHVRTDTLKDLSYNTMTLNGLSAWDLGSDNNKLNSVNLKFTSTSWFDAAGCARLTKQSKGGTLGVDQLDPKYVKSANCASNQSLPPGKGTWYVRAERQTVIPLTLPLTSLEIPKPTSPPA